MRTHWEFLLTEGKKVGIDLSNIATRPDFPETVMFCMQEFSRSGENIFRFGDAFSAELAKVSLKITTSVLTERTCCIEILDRVAYMSVRRPSPPARTSSGERIDFQASVLLGDRFSLLTSYYQIAFTDKVANLDSALEKCLENIETLGADADPRAYHDAVKLAFKAFVYVGSGDPDLRELRPPSYEGLPRRDRDRLKTKHQNDPGIPVTLVSWDWMKPKTYHVDETVVTGHFRWQPCGTARMNVKLIWISDHLRRYRDPLV